MTENQVLKLDMDRIIVESPRNLALSSERSAFLDHADLTERVYDEKRKSKPLEYIQTIHVLKYKHNYAISPREDKVKSRNYETTDEDLEEKTSVLMTHRVRIAKYSKIGYQEPTCRQKLRNTS